MPHNPVEFYVKACTDQEYYEKTYLFYYWNPFDSKCKTFLTGPKNSVDYIVAQVHGLDRAQPQASPNYGELKKKIQKNGELRVSILLGFNISSKNKNDEGRASYQRFQSYFSGLQFQIVKENHRYAPSVEYYRPASSGQMPVRVIMSLSTSDQNSPVTFAKRAREAFETSDIVLYVGHSGLGGNLNLDMITKLSSDDPSHPTPINFLNGYQIYYIDSCGSFYFYSEEYAIARRGVNNIDIITDGTASYFWTQNTEVLHFLDDFIENPKPMSWSQILSSVATQARSFSYLVNVSAIR